MALYIGVFTPRASASTGKMMFNCTSLGKPPWYRQVVPYNKTTKMTNGALLADTQLQRFKPARDTISSLMSTRFPCCSARCCCYVDSEAMAIPKIQAPISVSFVSFPPSCQNNFSICCNLVCPLPIQKLVLLLLSFVRPSKRLLSR
jgi:hypothetical protein